MNFEFRRFSADTNDEKSLQLHHDVCKFFDYFIVIRDRPDFEKVFRWYVKSGINVDVYFEDGCYRIHFSKDDQFLLYNKKSH